VSGDLHSAAAASADAVLRRFFGPDGRLKNLPAKQSRQLAVYDLLAQRFIPGVRYTELEVNRELMAVYDDYVTLRRGLIDFGLMDRAGGQYWRSGGTVPIAEPDLPRATDTPSPGGQSGASNAAGRGRPTDPGEPERITDRTTRPTAASTRGAARREAILTAAAELFAERGYAAVGMDDIGAAAGVTGPAIYRHFGAKASVLTSVFDRVIDAVTVERDLIGENATDSDDPAAKLRGLVGAYAGAVSSRRGLMAVFIREVHHLPAEDRSLLDERQRALIGRWRTLLARAHPDWDREQVRTAVHGAFGMLNSVGTFESPLPDPDLALQLHRFTCAALDI
jgi:AcrR family transcriptional regulator